MIKYVNQTIINLSGLAVDCTLHYSDNRQALNASIVTSSLREADHSIFAPATYVEPGELRRYSDSPRGGRSGDRIPVLIFRARPDMPWGPPSVHCNGYRIFTGGVAAGRGLEHPHPSSAEIKERVQLYQDSLSGP
jgi:hypothetical protein